MSNTLPPPVIPKTTINQNKTYKERDKSTFDLNIYHNNLLKARVREDNKTINIKELSKEYIYPTKLLYNLIDRDLWRLKGSNVLNSYVGYSTKHKSLTVSLFKGDEVKTICIRKALNKEGETVKWKTYGSKRYIPFKVFDKDDPVLLVGYGIGEFLLFELLEFNYMILQSDSIALSLQDNPYKPDIQVKYILALVDNDSSCKATIEPLAKCYKDTKVIMIDFENILDRELPKGYDFRDFCNYVAKEVRGDDYLADPLKIKECISAYIKEEFKKQLKQGDI